MKLGKSLIITGLLFSSVFGSVNVNNITAMAEVVSGENKGTDTDTTGVETVTAKYILNENGIKKNITDKLTSDVKVKKEFSVNKSDYKVTSTDIYLPSKYVRLDDKEIIANKANKTVEVNVKLAAPIVVNVNFIGANDKITQKLKNQTGHVNKASDDTEVTLDEFKIPAGYEIDGKPNLTINKLTDDNHVDIRVKEKKESITRPSHGGHSGYALQRVRISFIDQDGDEVGYKQLNGKDTFSSKIEAPAGYTLVNSSDATIKFNKKGNKDIKIKVTKNRPTPVMEKGIVTTNSGLYFHLYTIDGKEITNRGLSGDSKWFTDQYATINGEKMFRVATNEWVKATDVYK